jgi:uncharacterized membrane protein YhaH (DUF805 family)
MLSTLALLMFQEATTTELPAGAAAGMGVFAFVYIAVLLLAVVAMWKIFTKAGKPGWAALIPLYNIIVLLEIAGKPTWWVILFLVPFVNFVMIILVSIALAKNFGKGTGFGLGLAFLGFIFGPILAFGDAQYNPQP